MDKKEIGFPLVYRIQQQFEATSIKDIAECLRKEFARVEVRDRVQPGQNVAVAVGSRGIHDLVTIVATAVECLRGMELNPLLSRPWVPMGGQPVRDKPRYFMGWALPNQRLVRPSFPI